MSQRRVRRSFQLVCVLLFALTMLASPTSPSFDSLSTSGLFLMSRKGGKRPFRPSINDTQLTANRGTPMTKSSNLRKIGLRFLSYNVP